MRFLREYLLHRLTGGSRQRRRGVWMAPQRGRYSRPRHRSRSNVRVTGCCLPIPLGIFLSLTGLAVHGLRRGR